jgi:triosephosphate isomerase
MTKPLLFAANWKMNLGPKEARSFLDRFLAIDTPVSGRTIVFFPPAVSISLVSKEVHDRDDMMPGVQDIHWEESGAFTGETSVSLAYDAGARSALIGHSERRHIFGETDAETALKVNAAIQGGLQVVLCVGETLEERELGQTNDVVARQLRTALEGVPADAGVVVAYEPVWAIGTGKVATPEDASKVHSSIRDVLETLGLPRELRVLYGGSVKPDNAAALLAQDEIDGVLVGGASLEPESWAAICAANPA